MTLDPVAKPVVAYTEAPASWNTGYVTPDGFVCRITLRGENGKDLLEKAGIALNFLKEHGCMPESVRNHRGETRLCALHGVEMKCYQKDGKNWFSHRLEDGSYCYGKKKKEA